jgi:hypothetical protein
MAASDNVPISFVMPVKYFLIEAEVAGGFGPNTVLDRSVHPPIVNRLHYQFDGWLGDVLLESFPSFIVSGDARNKLLESDVTGARFDEVEISTSEQFRELYPERRLPQFAWLQVIGKAGQSDFGTTENGRLVISECALDVLKELGLSNAVIDPFDAR